YLQSRRSRRLQIRRLRDRKSRSPDVAVRRPSVSAAASGVADRRFVRGVREDHLSVRHLARHVAAGGVVTRLSGVRAVLPEITGGTDPEYHEMKSQIEAPPAILWSDLGVGFLRFARGIGRKLRIADPLGAFVSQIFDRD